MITGHKVLEEKIFKSASKFITELLSTNRKTLLLLSGGSAVGIYSEIKDQISKIKNTSFAQVDERFQPAKDEDINATQIEKTGLWAVCGKKNIPYYLVSQEGTLEEAAEKYNQTISKLFKEYTYKIAILGIGEDGHTAGLLPGYKKAWVRDKFVVGYEISHRQENAMALSCPDIIRQRITLTPKALQKLDQAIVVASGEQKREAIRKIKDMKIKDIDKYPAVLLHRIKKVDLFTDN